MFILLEKCYPQRLRASLLQPQGPTSHLPGGREDLGWVLVTEEDKEWTKQEAENILARIWPGESQPKQGAKISPRTARHCTLLEVSSGRTPSTTDALIKDPLSSMFSASEGEREKPTGRWFLLLLLVRGWCWLCCRAPGVCQNKLDTITDSAKLLRSSPKESPRSGSPGGEDQS